MLCVVASIPGVFLVAFFSDQNKTCLPDNVTNATNASDLIYNDHDFADSPTDSPCEPDPETSTPLGYVVSCLVWNGHILQSKCWVDVLIVVLDKTQ